MAWKKLAHTTSDDKEWYTQKIASHETGICESRKVHVLRLGPREDLLESLWKYARVTDIKAVSVVSVVGSLQHTNIRYANASTGASLTGAFEIVSVVGNIDFQKDTITDGGSGHIHISVSNEVGETVGGHLLSGNIIFTTAEITMLELSDCFFNRELDDGPNGSGYEELKVYDIKQ